MKSDAAGPYRMPTLRRGKGMPFLSDFPELMMKAHIRIEKASPPIILPISIVIWNHLMSSVQFTPKPDGSIRVPIPWRVTWTAVTAHSNKTTADGHLRDFVEFFFTYQYVFIVFSICKYIAIY